MHLNLEISLMMSNIIFTFESYLNLKYFELKLEDGNLEFI